MKTGTKSVLFGAHCFFIHPFFVAWGWWRLYGFPKDIRLWVAFFVHDLGYWGLDNMDDDLGEMHPWFGARLMSRLFDKWIPGKKYTSEALQDSCEKVDGYLGTWGTFTLLHSRFLSKRYGRNPSQLCAADKLAMALEPWWLYLPRVIATGEITQYMKTTYERQKEGEENGIISDRGYRIWHRGLQKFMKNWVSENAGAAS